jgi:hypothetical protein
VGVVNATDRCDRCGAQAYVGFLKEKGELMFCVHHGTAHEAELTRTGWEVVEDGRANLVNSK